MDHTHIEQVDAALQRLQQLRAGHAGLAADALLKQTLRELDRAIEELQRMSEELSLREEELGRLEGALQVERSRRIELMETLAVPCLFTDAEGWIEEANTTALLMLGASLRGGRHSLAMHADAAAIQALIARTEKGEPAAETLTLRPHGRPPITVRVSVMRIRNVDPPVWRWFLPRQPQV